MRFAVLPCDGGDDTTSAELRRSGAVVDGVAVVTHVIRAADIAASLPRAVGGAASGNRGAKGGSGSGSGAVAMGGVTALECLPRRLLVRYCPRCLLLAPSCCVGVLTYLVRVHVLDTFHWSLLSDWLRGWHGSINPDRLTNTTGCHGFAHPSLVAHVPRRAWGQ